jgi:hypothetical protein
LFLRLRTGSSLCCDNDESCCSDPVNGVICCETQQTFCCPPMPNSNLPSRCCPRWQVCCDGGRYGCCDPGTAKAASPGLYGMLFSALEAGNGLVSMVIDAGTGSYTYKDSPVFPTGGVECGLLRTCALISNDRKHHAILHLTLSMCAF